MKNLKSKLRTKKVEFDDDEVEIIKLNMKRMRKIQNAVKKLDPEDEEYQIKTIHATIRVGVVDAEDMTVTQFDEFNPRDLIELAGKVMEYAGVDMSAASEDESVKNSAPKTD